MPRHTRSVTSKTSSSMAFAAVLPLGDCARIGVLHFVCARLQLPDGAADSFQDVKGLESGDDDRNAVLLCQRRIFAGSHHAAHMPGREECLHAAVGDSMMAAMAGGTRTCETSSEKLVIPCARA